ncbi:protein-L-isoaspartate O-methyltransferase domain-containing protein 2-like [Clytia hemisphaerica]|uniref:SOCS box domain-containing protein n=1 Tax=Clytia hemisphaerica TaxID=252671 RepID=A0A7M5VAN2_9CNID
MGGVVPKGKNNDELVDNLIEAKYLSDPRICRIFRQVDRGDFYPGEYYEDAYRDQAMKSGNLHLSAPCIYCSVMENMDLYPGLSFLNIGSGTGYLSTMVGQVLGPFDTNHGIELFEDAINYSQSNIERFMKYSDGFQVTHFCKPRIVQGNVHSFDITFRQYDRVYVGARLMHLHMKEKIKELVKVGGVLIFPTGENLMKFNKVSETEWEEKSLLNVQFSDLIDEKPGDTKDIRIYTQPPTLKELSRQIILQNVFTLTAPEDEISFAQLDILDDLPLPRILIKYLRYFRDVNQPKPVSLKKHRTFSSDEDSFSSDDGDDDDDENGGGGGGGGGGNRIRFRIIIR